MPAADAVADLRAFLDASPSPFHAAAEAARRLDERRLRPDRRRRRRPRPRGFVVRDGALVAWATGRRPVPRCRLVGAHTDSPEPAHQAPPRHRPGRRPPARRRALRRRAPQLVARARPRPVGPGRAPRRLASRLVRVDEPLLHIPQLAIHLDREIITDGLQLNPQQHLAPDLGHRRRRRGRVRAVRWPSARRRRRRRRRVGRHDPRPRAGHGRRVATASCCRRPGSTTSCSCWAAVDALIERGHGRRRPVRPRGDRVRDTPGRRIARCSAQVLERLVGRDVEALPPRLARRRVPVGRHGARHAPELRRAPRARALDRPRRRTGRSRPT